MYWISLSLGDNRALIAHFGTKREARDFYNFLFDLHLPCKIKLYKNTELIEKCKLS